MLIIRGGINSKKRELCPTALALSAFYYNKNKHADTYIMYLHAYSTSATRKVAHCLRRVGHIPRIVKTWPRHRIRCQTQCGRNTGILLKRMTVVGCILKRQKTFTSSGHCSLPPPLLAVCLFLCICVAGIFVKIRLHVNTAVRVTCDVFSEVIVVARQDGI